MMTISAIPLSVLNEALRWYGEPPCMTPAAAMTAIAFAESRVDLAERPPGDLSPLAFALAQYMSLAGPWAEDGGEHAGESGWRYAP